MIAIILCNVDGIARFWDYGHAGTDSEKFQSGTVRSSDGSAAVPDNWDRIPSAGPLVDCDEDVYSLPERDCTEGISGDVLEIVPETL